MKFKKITINLFVIFLLLLSFIFAFEKLPSNIYFKLYNIENSLIIEDVIVGSEEIEFQYTITVQDDNIEWFMLLDYEEADATINRKTPIPGSYGKNIFIWEGLEENMNYFNFKTYGYINNELEYWNKYDINVTTNEYWQDFEMTLLEEDKQVMIYYNVKSNVRKIDKIYFIIPELSLFEYNEHSTYSLFLDNPKGFKNFSTKTIIYFEDGGFYEKTFYNEFY